MGNHPIDGMLGTTMEKIKEMVDVDSVIGKPITCLLYTSFKAKFS